MTITYKTLNFGVTQLIQDIASESVIGYLDQEQAGYKCDINNKKKQICQIRTLP